MAERTKGQVRVDSTVALGAYGLWTVDVVNPGHDDAGYPGQVCSVFHANKSDFPQEVRNGNAAYLAAAWNAADRLGLTAEQLDAGVIERLVEVATEIDQNCVCSCEPTDRCPCYSRLRNALSPFEKPARSDGNGGNECVS